MNGFTSEQAAPADDKQASDSGPSQPDPAGSPGTGGLTAWLRQGLRSTLFRRPEWDGLRVTPAIALVLFLATLAASLILERAVFSGPSKFYWQSLLTGWLNFAAGVWLCWLLVPAPTPPLRLREPCDAETPAALFLMLTAQSLILSTLLGLLWLPIARNDMGPWGQTGSWEAWIFFGVASVWGLGAQGTLLWRASTAPRPVRLFALVVLLVLYALHVASPNYHWYPQPQEDSNSSETAAADQRLTPEQLELQPQLLHDQLAALKPASPAKINLFSITFAPYGSENVFREESAMVTQLMETRFGARGRSLQLVNNRATLDSLPWATPRNLRRSILRMADLMDKERDVLFIHLTSHGGKDGKLAAEFWPLTVQAIDPASLKAWLDEAGIRYRVISISACYSGSWVNALSSASTLVMTASDADHTSFGCGSKSSLTYYGRAMFDEQLRQTLSFEKAFAAMRPVVEEREKQGAKKDGYSNPQISMGDDIRAQLLKLEAQLGQ